VLASVKSSCTISRFTHCSNRLRHCGISPTAADTARHVTDSTSKLSDENTPQFVTRLAFEVRQRLFGVAFQRSPTSGDATIDEGRRMLAAYLATYAKRTPTRAKKVR
jgi:hypothetical protein